MAMRALFDLEIKKQRLSCCCTLKIILLETTRDDEFLLADKTKRDNNTHLEMVELENFLWSNNLKGLSYRMDLCN